MYVNIKKLPGGQTPSEFRVLFHSGPGERPLETRIRGDAATLQEFLEKKLELDEPLARQYANQADFERSGAHFDRIPFDEEEIRKLIRTSELERRTLEKHGTIPVP